MEKRPYFIFGDLLACLASGVMGAWLAQLAMPAGISPAIGMVAGMAVGMLLGMLAGVVIGMLFSPLFGALEVSLPAGLAGILGGTAAGMLEGMIGIGGGTALLAGAGAGVLSLVYCYALQARLKGEAT